MINYPSSPLLYVTTPWTDSATQTSWKWAVRGSTGKWVRYLSSAPSETTASILTKLAPGTGGTGAVGAEYMPDALQVGVDPNVLTIYGITGPADSDPLSLSLLGHDFNGAGVETPSWGVGDWSVAWVNGVWTIKKGFFPLTYEALKSSTAKTPIGLTDWTVSVGVGQPVVEGNDQVASYIGQFGQAGPNWFRWTGSEWQEDVSMVVNELNLGEMLPPSSNAVFVALAEKAYVDSPNFTGTAVFAGAVIAGAPVRLKGYLVAALPASPTPGDTAFVTNALSPTYLGAVVGGGAVVAPVIFNGSAWVTH